MARIGPLINTKWGQGNKDGNTYNKYCVFELDRDVVINNKVVKAKGSNVVCYGGCSAVALAQVLAYYGRDGINGVKYKKGCCGIEPQLQLWERQWRKYLNDDAVLPNGFYKGVRCRYIVPGLDAIREFDYDNMPNQITKNSPIQQINAVAQLILYCGRALDSVYGACETSTATLAVTEAFNNLNLKLAPIEIIEENTNPTKFKNTLIQEIKAKRPVIMMGHNYSADGTRNGGHTFICDGYDDATDEFSFNWGYEGDDNGWRKLDNLTYTSKGVNYNKSWYKTIIILHQPDTIMGDCTDQDITLSSGNVLKRGDNCVSMEDALVLATNILNSPNHEIRSTYKLWTFSFDGWPGGTILVFKNKTTQKADLPFVNCDLNYDNIVTNDDLKLMLNKALKKELFNV